MDADERLTQEHASVAESAVPGQRASEEQLKGWWVGLERLAELLDAVVVHARTCDIQPLGDEAQRWSARVRAILADPPPQAGQASGSNSV